MKKKQEITFSNLINSHFVEVKMSKATFIYLLDLWRSSRSVQHRGHIVEGVVGMFFEESFDYIKPNISSTDPYDFVAKQIFIDVKYTESENFKNHLYLPLYLNSRKWMKELLVPKYWMADLNESNHSITFELVDLVRIESGKVKNRIWPEIRRKTISNPDKALEIKYVSRIHKALDTHNDLEFYREGGELEYIKNY